MQNEPNFRKSQMNVTDLLTRDYEKKTLGEHGKNEPKTNPNEPNQSQLNPIKPNIMPKQTQNEPNQSRRRALAGQFQTGHLLVDRMNRIMYYDIQSNNKQSICGGDRCLVVPLVFKTSEGLKRSRVGSIPIRLRHYCKASAPRYIE